VSLALYRKYRPGSFAEVRGQEHVTGPLRAALANGRIHHAYLFSGPRGCGKTSSARIMARSLNCVQGPTPDPCGVCESCVALAPNGPGSLDVSEIDAASHNGVDDARDLRDKAFYAPVSARFKVYIIDEAHMVTTAAFNALLKIVEEPPEFVKFIFATTEPERLLQTIRSRTHHYPFRLMPRKDLTALLQEVVASEGIPVEPQVLPLVVRAAAGSARDALSILDQVLASADGAGVSREAAAGLLGVTPDVLLDDVIDAFAVGDAAAVFATVDRVMEGGHDPQRFAADVLERLRDLVIYDAVPDAGEKGVLDCPPEQLDRMSRQAASLGTAGLSRAADLFHAGLTEMRGTTAPRLLLELVCARVLLPGASEEPSAVLTRVERLERRFDISGTAPAPAVPPRVAPAPARAPAPDAAAPARPTAAPQAREDAATPDGAVNRNRAARDAATGRDGSPGPDTRTAGDHPAAVPGAAGQDRAPAGGGAAGERGAAARDGATGRDGAPGDAQGSRPPLRPARQDPRPPAAPTVPAAAAPAASSAWPTAAVPGGGAGPAQPPAAAPEEHAQAPVGGLDAAAVRRVWDTVLVRVKEQKRVTHARLSETQVAKIEGSRLSVSFTTPTLARQFSEGVHVEVLKEALREVLGAELDVVCVSGPGHSEPGSGGAAPSGPQRGGPRAPAPPAHEGFAPGDEAAEDDAAEDDATVPVERGESAALRLVQQALGGQVVGTIGD